MQVIVALEDAIKTFTFPDDANIQLHHGPDRFLVVTPIGGLPHWFNPIYIIAIVPGTKAGG